MCRSSTFSSESVQGGGFSSVDWRDWLLALAVLLIVEFGVVRSGYIWQRTPDTMLGAFFGVEREVLAKAPQPTVVFMGSSRMRDAVEPRQLEAALNLPRGGVLNLGLTGGTPHEAALLYEHHRTLLKRARVIVLGIEDWYWNEGFPRGEVERHFATFGDRWQWFKQRHELGDLVGGVWHTLELQDALLRFGASFVKGVQKIEFAEDRIVWRAPDERSETGPLHTDVAGPVEHLMQAFNPGPAYENALRALMLEARDDGVHVIVTQIPLRAEYVDELERRYPRITPYMRARIDAIAHEAGAEVALYGRGTEVGIPDDRFSDFGHLTEAGVRRMTRLWERLLAPRL
jgi:hypothetical protein